MDRIGTTLVPHFKTQSPSEPTAMARIDMLHKLYPKPLMLTEVKVNREAAPEWLRQLREDVTQRALITHLMWSETPSAKQAQDPGRRG